MDLSKEEIKELIGKENPVIVEIGVYDGRDTLEFIKVMPNATVYGFECDPRAIAILKQRIADDRIIIEECAIGNTNSLVRLNLSDSDTRRHKYNPDYWSASSSIKRPKNHLALFKDVVFNREVAVPCKTLDKWQTESDVREIDFLWMDVNGAEGDVLLGGELALNISCRYIYMEFSNSELYEGQIKLDKIKRLLYNFKQVGIYNYQGNFGNVLLKNKLL
jgi:FkbM family methyltransferase